MPVQYGGRTFEEMRDYLRRKVPLPTQGHEDVEREQHDHAFMVAGANTTAMVEDFLTAITAAAEEGETLADFRARFDEIVTKHGWDYNGSRGWRSRLIYETNLRQAYNAGRETQMADPAFRQAHPYRIYRHSGAENYRPEHKAWDKLVLWLTIPGGTVTAHPTAMAATVSRLPCQNATSSAWVNPGRIPPLQMSTTNTWTSVPVKCARCPRVSMRALIMHQVAASCATIRPSSWNSGPATCSRSR